MAKNTRSIRITIPEEMNLSANEIASLEHAFKLQLQIVEKAGDVGVIINPINTTNLPVTVVLSKATESASSRKAAKKGRKSNK